MGLIKTALSSIGNGILGATANIGTNAFSSTASVVKDQYLEYFYCDALENGVLMAKGQKKNEKGLNKGNDNIISNGSSIIVNAGQCALIVDQGKIVEICAEPGEYRYDASSEPSLFFGKFGDNVKKSFESLGKRISYGGEIPKDQRVYYIKTNEVRDNAWGTQNPVPFFIHDKVTNFMGDINIIANGFFIYQVADPIIFYTKVASNVPDEFNKKNIHDTLRSSFLTAFQSGLGDFSEVGLRYSQITTMIPQLVESLNKHLSKTWGEDRGLELVDITFNTIKATPDDEARIKTFQDDITYGSSKRMMAGMLAKQQGKAMVAAAENEQAGMLAFAGLNMANQAGGFNAAQLLNQAEAEEAAAAAAAQAAPVVVAASAAGGWNCSCGKVGNTGKFCAECGAPKPVESDGWKCSCGAVNKGNFCSECGSKRPAGAPLFKCDKCGFQPEDPHNPPKFCPECGDIFDDNDKVQ